MTGIKIVIETFEQLHFKKFVTGYMEWKKKRPAKHEQIKAMRKAKEQQEKDKEYMHLLELYNNATSKTEKKALKRALYQMEVE